MNGTLVADSKGFTVRLVDTLWSVPEVVTTYYRVLAINDPYRRADDGASVRFVSAGTWRGNGFDIGTDTQPESTESSKVPEPKRRRSGRAWQWVDGQWK